MLFRHISLVDSSHTVRHDQWLRTEGEFITAYGPENGSTDGQLKAEGPLLKKGEATCDGRGKLLMPGFYNLHCHVPMTLLRGYGEGLPLDRWLNELIFPYEAHLTANDVYWATLAGAMDLIAGGSCSFSDMYFFTPDIARAVAETGLKANLSYSLSSSDDNFILEEHPAYIQTEAAQQTIDQLGGDRIKLDVSIHSEYTTTVSLINQAADWALDTGRNIQIHVSETWSEHEACKERHALTPVELLEREGVFRVPVTAAHCVWLDESDLPILRRHQATIAHNPSSNLKLGSGIADISHYLEEGISVGVGTDGASSNNNLDMLEELTLASLLAKGSSHDATALSPPVLLQLSGLNGAEAQGRMDCGLIEPGYRADLLVVDLSGPHCQPVHDPLSALFYSANRSDIVLNMVDGRVLYRDGEFLTIDREKVLWELNRSNDRIMSQLDGTRP